MKDWSPWDQFLEDVERAKAKLEFDPGEDCLYRGHSDVKHQLTPSLYRLPGMTADEYWQTESDLFFEFQSRSKDVRAYNSDWDVLFHMRHHGVPTRLLDWTEVFGVALFFAVQGYDPKKGKTPCVWVLNPWRLNEKKMSWNVRDMVQPKYLGWDAENWQYDDFGEILANYEDVPWDLPVAIYPQETNTRMAAQRGMFTIHGSRGEPLDELCPDCVARVDLSPEAVELVALLLQIVGVDQHLMFPDSDGLARALSEKYKLSGRPEDRVLGRPARDDEESRAERPPTRKRHLRRKQESRRPAKAKGHGKPTGSRVTNESAGAKAKGKPTSRKR